MPDEWKEASPVDVIKRFLRANRFRPTVSNSNSLSNFPASLFTFGPIRSPSRGKREDAENDLMAVPFAPPSIEEDNIVKKVGPSLPLSMKNFQRISMASPGTFSFLVSNSKRSYNEVRQTFFTEGRNRVKLEEYSSAMI